MTTLSAPILNTLFSVSLVGCDLVAHTGHTLRSNRLERRDFRHPPFTYKFTKHDKYLQKWDGLWVWWRQEIKHVPPATGYISESFLLSINIHFCPHNPQPCKCNIKQHRNNTNYILVFFFTVDSYLSAAYTSIFTTARFKILNAQLTNNHTRVTKAYTHRETLYTSAHRM